MSFGTLKLCLINGRFRDIPINIAFNEFRDAEILSLKLFFIGYISLYFNYGRKVEV